MKLVVFDAKNDVVHIWRLHRQNNIRLARAERSRLLFRLSDHTGVVCIDSFWRAFCFVFGNIQELNRGFIAMLHTLWVI